MVTEAGTWFGLKVCIGLPSERALLTDLGILGSDDIMVIVKWEAVL